MQPVLMGFLAPLLLGEKNNWLQWAGIAVGFVGVIIFIGADHRATEAALWVYLLPMLATASLYNAGLYSAVLAGAADRHLAVAACYF
jgi:drug/metabolite transporter (DMT)-like permease